MRSASPEPVRGTLEAWKQRIRAIMRELADRHEAGITSVSGFAALAESLAGHAPLARPVLAGAARRHAPGRG